MKKLFDIFVLILAVNFLALAGCVAWLWRSGHLDHPRVGAIKQVLFPPAAPEAPTTQPSVPDGPPTGSQRLDALLARQTGRSAAEQVKFVQQTFDATMTALDRREQDVAYREAQVAHANQKLAEDYKAIEAQRQQLLAKENQADTLANDKGFQDTLGIYNSMTGKQVKQAFMTLDESSAAQYLDAMQPRTAARILKEFKRPDEVEHMNRILEKMRHPPAVAAAGVAAPPGNAKE